MESHLVVEVLTVVHLTDKQVVRLNRLSRRLYLRLDALDLLPLSRHVGRLLGLGRSRPLPRRILECLELAGQNRLCRGQLVLKDSYVGLRLADPRVEDVQSLLC